MLLETGSDCLMESGGRSIIAAAYPASIARLRSLMDKYPLYSHADEALYLLGQSYQR